MVDCKPTKNPVNPDVKLTSSEDDDHVCDLKMYQVLVGSLLSRLLKHVQTLHMLWDMGLVFVTSQPGSTGQLPRGF